MPKFPIPLRLEVPDEAWLECGGDDDPTSRLLASGLEICGLSMHLTAYAVQLTAPGEHGEQFQVAADVTFDREVEMVQDLEGTSFQTTTIRGREYILVATPHGD